MKLYKHTESGLKRVQQDSFSLEKDIQDLVETNTNVLFGLEFVASELTIENFRLDTLCYDRENNAFVIIEYKRDKNFSVIDQGYTYLSLMLNSKAEFILEYNETQNVTLKREDVDWTQSRILFVSPRYTPYQKHSVNFKDVPFELWEIHRYSNDTVALVKHEADSDQSIETTTTGGKSTPISSVSKEVKVYTEDYHVHKNKRRPKEIIDLYFKLKERILDLDDQIEMKVLAQTIQFKIDKSIVDLIIYNKAVVLILNIEQGQLDDPRGLTEDISNKGHWGNGDYRLYVKPDDEIEYAIYLIEQVLKRYKEVN